MNEKEAYASALGMFFFAVVLISMSVKLGTARIERLQSALERFTMRDLQ